MAKFKIVFLVLALIISSVSLVSRVSANEMRGEIIDIFGDNITTIQINDSHNLKVGDKIDLTYMAGVLPMAVGVYEVTTVQSNVVLCKPISMNMPANKGMNIKIDVLKNKTAQHPEIQPVQLLGQEPAFDPPNPAGMDLPSQDPRFMNVPPAAREVTYENNPVSDVKVKGEVVEVMGTDVRIKLETQGAVEKGYAAEVTYTTSSGMELPVGMWIVESVAGTDVTAQATDTSVTPRKGMTAVVYKAKEKLSVVNDLPPAPDQKEEEFFGEENIFEDDRAAEGKGYDAFQSFFDPAEKKISPAVQEDTYFLGNEDATVTVTAFAGFECPFSKKIYPNMFKVIRPHLSKVKYVLRHYPLPMHKNAVTAIKAAFAAGRQGKYWKMTDALFAEKKELNQKNIERIAKRLQLNMQQFANDYNALNNTVKRIVEQDMKQGQQWGIRGTPSYYINGKQVPHNDIEAFKKEIEKLANSSDNLAQIVAQGVQAAGQPKRRYWLGVEIMNNEDANGKIIAQYLGGVIVRSVMSNSPAERAGLQKGDHILRVNRTGVNNTKHFVDLINSSGSQVKLELRRNGKKIKKKIKLDAYK